MTDDLLSFDFGNRLVKATTDYADYAFLHDSARLSDAQFTALVERGDVQDIYVVNNIPYVIGERAARYGGRFAEGANRYEDDYYQRFLAVALWHCFAGNAKNITLYAGHAPRDINYRDDIKLAGVGAIKVEHNGEKRLYKISNAHCWDEPVGGLMNKLLTYDGRGFLKNDYNQGVGLVIDIGGLTIDYVLMENAKPDYLSTRSFTDKNIIDAVQDFAEALRRRYPKETKNRNGLPKERLYDGIHTGKYDAGAYGMLDCQHEADAVCEDIVDSIYSYYQTYGGEQLHFVLLTGGGAGLLEQRIRKRLMINGRQRRGVELAHNRDGIHMANVLGAHKMAKLYRVHGKI